MTKHRTDVGVYGQPMPPDWFQSLMEFLGSLSAGTVISLANPTTVQVEAAAGNGQVALAIEGKWRYNSVKIGRAHV